MSETVMQYQMMENPPSWRFVIAYCLLSLFFGFGGAHYLNGSLAQRFVAIFLLIIAFSYLIITFNRELVHRPTRVIIDDDGVILYFRFSKSRRIPWDVVVWVNAFEGNSYTKKSRWARWGALKPVKGHFYDLQYEVANEIWEAYRKNIGRYPTTMEEYEAMKRRGNDGAWR